MNTSSVSITPLTYPLLKNVLIKSRILEINLLENPIYTVYFILIIVDTIIINLKQH